MKRLAVALCLAVVAAPAMAQDVASVAPAARRRVAVLNFDYTTVQSNVTGLLGPAADIGKGVVVELESELVKNGTFMVMERTQVDRILNEQNFQQTSRTDASSAARMGKLLGADAVIIGSIIQFDRQNSKIAFGLKKETKAIVVIDARVVGMATGEILAVAEGKGEAKRSTLNTDEDTRTYGRTGDAWSAQFANTILGEATRAAVDSIVVKLVAAASKIPAAAEEIAALVADVSGDQLIINLGLAGGIKVGMEYAVERPGREIKDPATGAVLRRATTNIGKLKITSADDRTATGTLTGDPAHVGDCVGACPLLSPAVQPSVAGRQSSPATTSTVQSGTPDPRPANYTAFTWRAYAFTGTEHFRYEAQSGIGQRQPGFYEIDASPAGDGHVLLRIQGQVGNRAYSTTVTVAPNEPIPVTQLSQLGPGGLLFSNGIQFSGREWQLGADWSVGGAQNSSMKVESTCQHAGLQGLRAVTRLNGNMINDVCVSPNVGLPLAVVMGNPNAPTGYIYALTLTQYRP